MSNKFKINNNNRHKISVLLRLSKEALSKKEFDKFDEYQELLRKIINKI